jgi:hypothetical protein
MKEVEILKTEKNTIKVFGVQVVGQAINLHVIVNGVDLLENLDATEIKVTLSKDDGQ